MSKWPCGRREQLGVVWDFPEKPKSKATSTERNRHRKGHLWRSPVARVVMPEITRSQAPNAAMRCQAASNPAHGSGAAPIRRNKRRRHRQRNTGAENHRRSAPLRSIAARCIEMSPSPMADENRFVLCWMCLKSASQKPRQTNAADIESDTIGDHQRRRRAGCPRPSPVAEHDDTAPSHFKPYNLKWQVWRYVTGRPWIRQPPALLNADPQCDRALRDG